MHLTTEIKTDYCLGSAKSTRVSDDWNGKLFKGLNDNNGK
jgi:hypothetical protein